MAGLRLRRPRTAIERLYPHPLHQRLHMTTADLAPLGSQQASQHPRAGKGELQMQTVETPHDRKVGFRHRAWQIVDAATADVQSFRLLGDGQVVRALDHRFALSKPALPSAPSKKSFSSVSSPILACSDFTSMAGCAAPLPPGPNTSAAPSSSCAFHGGCLTEKIAGKNRRTLSHERFASDRGEFSPNGSQSGYSARVV